MSGGVLVGAVEAGGGEAGRAVGVVTAAGAARSPSERLRLAHWIVGHTMMLAVMAFAMIGGHSVARTGVAVLVFLGWAAVVAVRVRLGRLPADVHSVVDLLAMAAITAVPLLTAARSGGHHGQLGVATGAATGTPSAGAVLVASGVFAAWIVFRSGLRGIAVGGADAAPRLAAAGTAVTAASLGMMVLAIAAGWH